VGGRTSGLMELGEDVTWEAVHLGVRQRLTARITAMDRPRAFVDEMVRGAFARFRHIHEFHEERGGTRMVDDFDYRAPLGILGRIADVLFLERYMTRFLAERADHLRRAAERAAP
jgi:ligand-binding SRPBCC domain-containing protein